ncbi:MAG: hypothetical protein ACXVZR_05315, partial [Terriglobales bacterium]
MGSIASIAGAREWFLSQRSSSPFRYGFAAVMILLASGITWVIPALHSQNPGALMLTAIVLSALYAGLG